MTREYKRTWETRRGGRSVADQSRDSYYGVPVIKAPHWNWMIIVYFFLGGISSATYVISCIAELIGGRTNYRIERVARYVSLATLIPSPFLLIFDLGRPERFLHMLRIFKLRSPMSVGTWGLTFFGIFVTISAMIQAAQDGLLDRVHWLKRILLAIPCNTINLIGSFFGFFVGGYTGVLLAITAVPIWARNHLLLGPLFLSSALSSGAAALSFVFSLLRGDHRAELRRLERIDLAVLTAELGLIIAARANLGPILSRPIRQGRLKHIFRFGVLGTGIIIPLTIQIWGMISGRHSRLASGISALCALIGGYCVRHVMVHAGYASAQDPAATFEYARMNSEEPSAPETPEQPAQDSELRSRSLGE